MLEAGCRDQFGGESCPEPVVGLVEPGRVPEYRLDASLRRLLREKFVLGLFDDSYVGAGLAAETVGRADLTEAGARARGRSLTLLTDPARTLPLSGRPRLHVRAVDPVAAAAYGQVVTDPARADIAVLRPRPHEPRADRFESFFHSGTLAFFEEELRPVLDLLDTVPTSVCLNLERPAVVPEIAECAAVLITDCGASDDALLDVVFGRAAPERRPSFERPRPMAVVEASRPGVPDDTAGPLFPRGAGPVV